MIPQADIRDYEKYVAVPQMDWRNMLIQNWESDRSMVELMTIVNDPKLATAGRQKQFEEFHEKTGQSRPHFFNLLRKLQPMT